MIDWAPVEMMQAGAPGVDMSRQATGMQPMMQAQSLANQEPSPLSNRMVQSMLTTYGGMQGMPVMSGRARTGQPHPQQKNKVPTYNIRMEHHPVSQQTKSGKKNRTKKTQLASEKEFIKPPKYTEEQIAEKLKEKNDKQLGRFARAMFVQASRKTTSKRNGREEGWVNWSLSHMVDAHLEKLLKESRWFKVNMHLNDERAETIRDALKGVINKILEMFRAQENQAMVSRETMWNDVERKEKISLLKNANMGEYTEIVEKMNEAYYNNLDIAAKNKRDEVVKGKMDAHNKQLQNRSATDNEDVSMTTQLPTASMARMSIGQGQQQPAAQQRYCTCAGGPVLASGYRGSRGLESCC